jgi:hypothetical protein
VASGAAAYSRNALDVTEWRPFRLAFKQTVSKDTVKLTFELPDKKTMVSAESQLLSRGVLSLLTDAWVLRAGS